MISISFNLDKFKIIKNEQGLYLKELVPTTPERESFRVPDYCYFEVQNGKITITVVEDIFDEKESLQTFATKGVKCSSLPISDGE